MGCLGSKKGFKIRYDADVISARTQGYGNKGSDLSKELQSIKALLLRRDGFPSPPRIKTSSIPSWQLSSGEGGEKEKKSSTESLDLEQAQQKSEKGEGSGSSTDNSIVEIGK